MRNIPQDLQTTTEQKCEWPLGGKIQAAKEEAAGITPEPQAAISATFGPLRHNRTLPINKHKMIQRLRLVIQQLETSLCHMLKIERTKQKDRPFDT